MAKTRCERVGDRVLVEEGCGGCEVCIDTQIRQAKWDAFAEQITASRPRSVPYAKYVLHQLEIRKRDLQREEPLTIARFKAGPNAEVLFDFVVKDGGGRHHPPKTRWQLDRDHRGMLRLAGLPAAEPYSIAGSAPMPSPLADVVAGEVRFAYEAHMEEEIKKRLGPDPKSWPGDLEIVDQPSTGKRWLKNRKTGEILFEQRPITEYLKITDD